MKLKKFYKTLFSFITLLLLVLSVFSYVKNDNIKTFGGSVFGDSSQDVFFVTRVIDGDTIEIEGKYKVRYIGIDTPESTIKKECFGEEAKKALEQAAASRDHQISLCAQELLSSEESKE